MNLTYAEAHDPLWQKLKEHFESEQQKFRRMNDSLDNSERDTTLYRAHIKLLEQLINLDKEFREKK